MTLTEGQKRGIVATVIFYTGVLLILLFFGFVTPFPPPEEQGILLDFGNSETGLGVEEPSAAQTQKEDLPKVIPPPPKRATPAVSDEEEILTQDYEKTVAIKSALKKKADNDKKIKIEEERQLREESDRQKRLEEIEKNRIAEAERARKEEAAKTLAINSRAKNAFGGGKTETASQSRGQGITYGPGNQGSADGAPGANQYGNGSGTGNGSGSGTSFTLEGRRSISLPKPNFPGNEAGVVVVEVTVDKSGKVTQALPGIKGSNTIDAQLLQAAKKAAMSAVFNADPNASAFQRGTITYHFVLQ